MSNQLPERKQPKLIVAVAFDRYENGDLQAVFGPAEQQSEERAIRTARTLATKHVGAPSPGSGNRTPRWGE